MADDPLSEFDKRSAEGYTQFVRAMPRPPPRECTFRDCKEPKLKHSLLFCALHEIAWIAYAGSPSSKLDSTQVAGAVAWAKNYRIQT